MAKYDRILVEEYIPGREIQVAIMGENRIGSNRTCSKKTIL